MVKLDIEGERAAKLLSEGNPKAAIEILKGEEEVSRALRNMLAEMLDGFGPNNTTLEVKSKNGRIKKSNSERDWKVFQAVEQEIEKSGCSQDGAFLRVSSTGLEMLGKDAVQKVYQAVQRAINENYALQRDG